MGSVQHIPASGAVEHGYPHGHLGHLTDSETQALKDFKVLLEEKGQWKPGPPASHDDATLLRFLRARRFVVSDPQMQGAFEQFSATESLRKANQFDILYSTFDVDAFEETRKLYPRYTGRRDKRGIPIYVYQIKHLDSRTVAAYEKETKTSYSKALTDGKTSTKLLRLIGLYENLTRFIQPLSTFCTDRPHAETPITLSTNIVDISEVGLKTFWNLKGHMQLASELATANYPETLDRIFIIGAPAFFSTVWAWIKRWFDPVTVSKIFILGPGEVIPVLTGFIDIKNIPKAYGGELEWGFFDNPSWDDEIQRICKWENGHTTFPLGPLIWKPIGEEGTKEFECLAVGQKDGKDREERVCTVTWDPQVKRVEEENAATEPGAGTETTPAATTTEETKPSAAENGTAPATEPPTAEVAALSVSDDAKKDAKDDAEKADASVPPANKETPVTTT